MAGRGPATAGIRFARNDNTGGFSRNPPFLKGVRGILPTVMNYARYDRVI